MSDAQRLVSLPHIETPEDFKAWTYSNSGEIKKEVKRCPKHVANSETWAWFNNKLGDLSSDLTTRLNPLNARVKRKQQKAKLLYLALKMSQQTKQMAVYLREITGP